MLLSLFMNTLVLRMLIQGEEPEEEEETSAPITISAPKSTTMMSTAAVSTTALASASRPVITGQTYERRDSRFSDPTSSSSSPTSHGTHKVPVKEIKSLPGNNNANKSGKYFNSRFCESK
ncbi:hypothetical protein KQX54_009290 [Cotesia glomerata]|uniref:Uncharacterized protein n=1 Tax=Cotesia glomerata TaxID=32391 RepID=A0AAV7IJS6_COTGL|nr:hypothetical protein KQX54_009290 [Cotesia glomerata]